MQTAALLFPATPSSVPSGEAVGVSEEEGVFAALVDTGPDNPENAATEPVDGDATIAEAGSDQPAPAAPTLFAFWPLDHLIVTPEGQLPEARLLVSTDETSTVPAAEEVDAQRLSVPILAGSDWVIPASDEAEATMASPVGIAGKHSDWPELPATPPNRPDDPAVAVPSPAAVSVLRPEPLAGPDEAPDAASPPPAAAAPVVVAQGEAVEPDPGVPVYWQLRVAQTASPPVAKPEAKGLDDGDTAATVVDAGDPTVPADSPAMKPLAAAPPALPSSSPTAPTAATLPPAVPAQVAAIVSTRPESPVELRLSPAELGHLRLHMTQEGEALRVTIQVERPETLDLMRRHADVLMTEIRNAGFSGGTLSFTGWGADSQGGPGTDRQSDDRAIVPEDARPSPDALAASSPPPPQAVASGSLNLRL